MVRWRENLLILSFTSQLRREDFALDVPIGPYIRDWKGDSLVHHLSIEILTLDILLPFSREQLNRVRIREAGVALLLACFLQVSFLALNLVVDKHRR